MLCLGDKKIYLHFKNVTGIMSWRFLRLDEGTTCNMVGNCGYFEWAVAIVRQGIILQLDVCVRY